MIPDNYTTGEFTNDTTKEKKSKSIAMRFYWLKDRETKNNFISYEEKET